MLGCFLSLAIRPLKCLKNRKLNGSVTVTKGGTRVKSAIKEWLDNCVEKLNAGELTEADLRRVTTALNSEKQLLLYLYSKSTNLRSPLGAWALYDATAPDEPVLPSQDAPYASVLDAVNDGWRIVQFPRPELYNFTDVDNAYLTYEFILEKFV